MGPNNLLRVGARTKKERSIGCYTRDYDSYASRQLFDPSKEVDAYTNIQLDASPQIHPERINLALNSYCGDSRTDDGESHGDDDQ